MKTAQQPGQQAALILLYGTTDKKYRPLDRDVIVLGRARGADIGLDAPDVSALHCVIWRGPEGYHIRDCASRAGTRINGDSVKDGLLHDGDVLQVGPFCFRVYLPGAIAKSGPHQVRQRHVERSRRNLARLALVRRKKLKDLKALLDLAVTPGDLQRKASGLRSRVREFEQRLAELHQRERELAKDRELFDQERAAHQAKVRESEQNLAHRRAAFDADRHTNEPPSHLAETERGTSSATLNHGA